MPEEYLKCKESLLAKGKSLKDAQRICAIAYYKRHGKTPQQAENAAVEVTDKYIRIRQRDPGAFQEGSFRTIVLSEGQGIHAVIGRLKGETSTTVQSYLFEKEKWTPEKARAWVSEHKKSKASTFEQDELDLFSTLELLGPMMYVDAAVWTTAYMNDLPDSCFLFVEPGEKDDEGKTVPRSKRHFPYKDKSGKVDLPHVRNAIARIPQSNAPGLSPEKKKSLQERARKILGKGGGGNGDED